MSNIAVIGAGVMGETLISGLLGAGWRPSQITAVDRYAPRLAEMATKYGIGTAELADAVATADAVLVVTKPQDVSTVLPQVASSLRPGAMVVSVCAGVTTAQIESYLSADTAVVRVMPNTPAQVGEGMAAISGGTWASEKDLAFAGGLLEAVGKVVTVPEKYQDAVTAVSGSGPAYVFYVVEAMIDAGVLIGLPRDIATTLAVQTVYGSAKLLVESGAHPTQLRERVTSPGGTTAAALRELDDSRVKAAFMAAIEAARDRSEELAGD